MGHTHARAIIRGARVHTHTLTRTSIHAHPQEAQRNKEYSNSFKPQRTKDEKTQRRKQILSSIGEDLLLASADKPFR